MNNKTFTQFFPWSPDLIYIDFAIGKLMQWRCNLMLFVIKNNQKHDAEKLNKILMHIKI